MRSGLTCAESSARSCPCKWPHPAIAPSIPEIGAPRCGDILYQDNQIKVGQLVDDLLSRTTLEDKVGLPFHAVDTLWTDKRGLGHKARSEGFEPPTF
jgi:hypothetical protein